MTAAEFWNGRRVFVTGGAGFVGRWLCRALSATGAEVHVLDKVQPSIRCSYHELDLNDLPTLQRLLDRFHPSAFFHLAGQPGVQTSHDRPLEAFSSNVLGTMNVLEAARGYGRLNSLVSVSSNHVYGHQQTMPTAETAPLNGSGVYAATKLCADVLSRSYAISYGVPVGIARITNSYGPDDHHLGHLVTGTILAVLRHEPPVIKNSGRDRKGYLYIEDTVDGLMVLGEAVATRPELKGEAFNFVPDSAPTVFEVVRAACAAAGSSLCPMVLDPEAEFEQEHLCNVKARELLGWAPRYSLVDGLRETVGWYRDRLRQ